ncbi:toxin-antitoxin system YwqK family antitoxin [Mesonia sediminis]|uniref:Toxin-antitoxin system YwqK family antitoxin n=1 Tax=Mesonia sediminis TaxID=1703946 RepID=A0ABW5SCZ9_9FLAO
MNLSIIPFYILVFLSFTDSSFAQEKINQFDQDGKRHGRWIKKYEKSDQIRYEGQFEHGKEVGVFKFYKPKSGQQPVATKIFQAHTDTILVEYFNQYGNTVSKGGMIGQKREGTWLYYHKNSDQLMLEEHYKNNRLHGLKKTYFITGEIAQIEEYKHGKLDGELKIFGTNNQLLQHYTYQEGKLHGKTRIYDAAGELISKGNYKHGKKDGIWLDRQEDGSYKETQHPLPLFISTKK